MFRRAAAALLSGRLLAAGLALALGACASSQDFEEPVEFEAPETSVAYEAEVTGAPTEEIDALMRDSLLIFRRQDEGAQSVAFLRRRARGDVPTAEKILRSFGYYRPTIEVDVRVLEPAVPAAEAEPGETTVEAAAAGQAGPDGPVPGQDAASETTEGQEERLIAELIIDPGPPYILQTHNFRLSNFEPDEAPALGPASVYGSPIGKPAAAAGIITAEGAAVAALREAGRPYAEATDRDAVINVELATMEVDTLIDTGRAYRFGPVSFEGAPNVEDDYLRTYLPWQEGERIDARKLAEYQRELLATGLFRAGTVTLPDEPPEEEIAPVTVTLEEAPFRTVAAGLRYDTNDGPSGRLRFEHRNLFGENETFEALLDAGIDDQILRFTYTEPQIWRPGQDWVTRLEFRRVEEDFYDERGATLTSGLRREVGEKWTVGYGGLAEYSDVTNAIPEGEAYLLGIPTFAAYDGSNDLLNPTTGQRFRVDVTPFGGTFNDEGTTFLTIDSRASTYHPIDSEARYVVAARGRLGSVISDGFFKVPSTRRLYSGGSGSVRAYGENFIGPLDDTGDPIGGRSVIEFGLEMRAQVWGDIGVVGFVEGGSVSPEIFPDFEEGFQYGVGAGLRYLSPVGPLRVDVAVPIDPRPEDDSFQFYISIGQAF